MAFLEMFMKERQAMRNILLASATAATMLSGLGAGGAAFAQQATGSYQGSCRNTQTAGGVLSAECADGQGQFHTSSIPYTQCRGDIGNNNGMLTCNGATGSGGALVGNAPGGRNQPQPPYAQGSRNQSQPPYAQGGRNQPPPLYTPGYSYPTYGEQRYGNPQYDPRYAQGGYAYGHQGQFVPIAQRAQWLQNRINRGLQQGTLNLGEARSLRQALSSLQQRETSYRRQGMKGWMMVDLDKRFDQLAARIR